MKDRVDDIKKKMDEGDWDHLTELFWRGRLTRREVMKALGAVTGTLGVGGLVGGAGALLEACAPSSSSKSQPTELIAARTLLWTTLDAEFTRELATQEAVRTHLASLLRYKYVKESSGFWTQDPTQFDGVLAESWDVSPDGKTYTFHLRHGALSVAGNPLTADDVMYSHERRFGIKGAGAFYESFLFLATSIDQWQRVDDYTVTLTIPQTYGLVLHGAQTWNAGAVQDSKLMKANATASDPWSQTFAQTHDHGFGAYKLVSFSQGAQANWVANEGYALGPAKIKKLLWQVVPEPASRLSLIEKGQVHIATFMTPTEQADAKSKGLTIPTVSNSNYQVFGGIPVDKAPYDNKLLRQAFLYTIPYDQIIQKIYNGNAHRDWDMILPNVVGANYAPWMMYTTDIAKAKALIAQAGYPNGVDWTITFQLSIPDMTDILTLIKESAAPAGMNIVPRGVSDAQFNSEESGTTPYPLMLKDELQVQSFAYPASLLLSPTAPFVAYNHGRAQSTAFWALIQKAEAVADWSSPEAVQYWNQAQALLADDAVMFGVCWVNPSEILANNVDGWVWNMDIANDYWHMSFKS